MRSVLVCVASVVVVMTTLASADAEQPAPNAHASQDAKEPPPLPAAPVVARVPTKEPPPLAADPIAAREPTWFVAARVGVAALSRTGDVDFGGFAARVQFATGWYVRPDVSLELELSTGASVEEYLDPSYERIEERYNTRTDRIGVVVSQHNGVVMLGAGLGLVREETEYSYTLLDPGTRHYYYVTEDIPRIGGALSVRLGVIHRYFELIGEASMERLQGAETGVMGMLALGHRLQ